jgi:hypothetical protein
MTQDTGGTVELRLWRAVDSSVCATPPAASRVGERILYGEHEAAVAAIRSDISVIQLTEFIEDLPATEISATGIGHSIGKTAPTDELAEALGLVLARKVARW